jgi:hypothetical protein
MTRLEKIKLAIKKGYTCDINTGIVYGLKGNELIRKNKSGYKSIRFRNKTTTYFLLQHHFIYYIATGKIVEEIDHINGDRADNRIDNLRSVNRSQNQHNRKTAKGYYWQKKSNKCIAQIVLNNKVIYLGCFDQQEEARKAYLDAKKIYHKI